MALAYATIVLPGGRTKAPTPQSMLLTDVTREQLVPVPSGTTVR